MTKNGYYCDCNVIHSEIVEKVESKMLPKEEFEQITIFAKALADQTRIKIVWALFNNEMCVCDLANLLSMTKSAISHQLRELRLAKLVSFKKNGKTVYYSLSDKHVENFLINASEHVKE